MGFTRKTLDLCDYLSKDFSGSSVISLGNPFISNKVLRESNINISNAIRNIFKLRQIPEETVGKGNCSITVIKLERDQKELIMGFNNMHLKELYT